MNRVERLVQHLQHEQITASPTATSGPYYLGLDSSTQSLKVLVIDGAGNVVFEHGVNFERDFPEYKTDAGVYKNGLEATAPTMMFVQAVDTVLTVMYNAKKI